MEKQNSMKINQLPSKTWYWLGLNDTKVKWAAGAPCRIHQRSVCLDRALGYFSEVAHIQIDIKFLLILQKIADFCLQ